MDKTKLKVLREVGYTVLSCCGLCIHASFPQNDWGTCGVHQYQHEKHTGDYRDMSVTKFGTCVSFEQDPVIDLAGFSELTTY